MLSLRLCGTVALTTDDDGALVTIGGKALALLSVLALEPRAHRREELTTLLWGEYPDARAKASLRQALMHLRQAIGSRLRVDRSTVELTAPLRCDVTDFLRLAREEPSSAIAIDVPHFLDGLTIQNCPAFDEWAERHRTALTRRYRELLAGCTRDAFAKRQWLEAARVAERWRDVEPLVDEPAAALMEAYFLTGNAGAARSVFAEHTRRLAALGVRGAGRALTELAARIDRDSGSVPRSPHASEAWYDQGPSFAASLIGRTAEWTLLREAWDEVAGGASRVVLIEGEPGVGKTRLAEDFARRVASLGGVVLRGRGYDTRSGPPFGAVIEILGSAINAPGVAGVDPQWLAEVARVAPHFRTRFPRLPDPSAAGAADGWRLFEAIAQVVTAIAEDDPVAMVIDDLHWCDADSCGLLHYLVRRLQAARVLWCVTFSLGVCERDAPAARLDRALRAVPGATSMLLPPLDEEGVWRLVRELGRVDAPAGGRRLAARIHEVTAGNPFYIVELLKTMFAQGLLTVEPTSGSWSVPASVLDGASGAALSPSVHEAVAERIECLPDELRLILISIAVAGRGCRSEMLSHVHGISRLHAAARADSLVERHLVDDEDGLYRCAHPIIGHVVREGLSASRRREVHRALALTLELLRASPAGGDDDGEIARHAEQAGEHAMAYKYALAASDGCARRCAYEEALSWLDLAATTAASAAESGVVDRITARVLEQAGWHEAPGARAPGVSFLGGVERADLDLPARS
jgi:DNA-binding SARP family transcriptional activator